MASTATVRPVRPGSRASRPSEILDAAIEVFLEQGFSNASMAQIAARARASKETIYNHFGSKEQLFAAIVEAMSQRIVSDFDLVDTGDVRASLTAFGRGLLDVVLDPTTTALYRVIIAEAPRLPDLGPTFFAHGPLKTLNRLTGYLRAATEAGRLSCDDPDEAAALLSSMLVGIHWQRSIIGAAPPLPAPARPHWVDACIDMFLSRYGPA